MFRRHPILTSLAALLLFCAAALAVFVLTFDLDRYREQLQQTLSRTLAAPVQLGKASLSLRHGPAFEFAELRIGEQESPTGFLQAEKLFVKLELRPLLEGQLTLSRILLQTPEIRLALPATTTEKIAGKSAEPIPPPWWSATLVRSFQIEDGSLFLLIPQGLEDASLLEIEQLNLDLENLGRGTGGQIELSGELRQEGAGAPFSLQGEVRLPASAADWRRTLVDLRLEVDQVAPAPLLASFGVTAEFLEAGGTVDLRLSAEGNPAAGMQFALTLAGHNLSLAKGREFRRPVPVQNLSLQGTWLSTEQDERLDALLADLDGISLKGELAARRQEQSWWIEGGLDAESSLAQLTRLLPDSDPLSWTTRIKNQLSGGSLRLGQLRFAGTTETLRDPARQFGLQQADIHLSGGVWNTAQAGPLDQLSLEARLRDGSLAIEQGRGRLWGEEFRFSGGIIQLFQFDRQIGLQLTGTLATPRLLELLGERKNPNLQASGQLPVRIELSGPPHDLTLDGSAHLAPLEMNAGQLFDKPAGLESDLFFTARLTPARFELSHGRLNLPPIDARIRGTVERGGKKAFEYTLDLDGLDMEKATSRFPILQRLQPRGSIGASFQFGGAAGKLQSYHGTLFLRDLGLHLTRVIADLNQVNGQVEVAENRAVTGQLSARLGSSAMKITGTLDNFADPRIELRVKAAAIRADDLIFRSDRDYLRDVDGHLRIDREALHFDPVRVRLDGGTQAVVTGSVSDFKAPRTRLDIRAEYGNIDEVIGLWQGPEKPAGQPPGHPRETSLLITAYARHGHLGGLKFQEADGEITLRDGVLVIYPLHFRAEQGYGVGQVAVARQDSGPSLLKISGHIENFRAGAVYSDLLHRPGLVTGTLRGDFYLEGLAGKEFLPSSSGGFQLEIRNGVLRKFRGLARVFSLLNVSQLFALQLPDMATEGMPFNRLSAGIALSRGVLSTEDLLIDSNAMNMSLVGSLDLNKEWLDTMLGVKPLRTVDKIITGIPVAGWLLAGEEKALLTAHFQIKGDTRNPDVVPMPINTVSEKVLGIFKRVLGLPGKVITDLGGMGEGKSAE